MQETGLQSKKSAAPFRVLTIDGGGMRGLYSAKLLQTLSKRFNANYHRQDPDIGKAFNLICGTSTGAILACGLAAGIPLSHILDLYIKKGPEIFPDQMPNKAVKLFSWAFKYRSKPAADAKILKDALTSCFQQTTLEQIFNKRARVHA